MTLTTRNTILKIGLGAMVLLAAAFGAAAAVLVLFHPEMPMPPLVDVTIWWGGPPQSGHSLWMYFGLIGGLVVFALVSAFSMNRFFRKYTAPEMLFFLVFMFTIPLEGTRIAQILIHAEGLPLVIRTLATRVLYFGYLTGVFSLFASSLYITEFDQQRTGTALMVVLALAFAVVYIVPVDGLELYPNLVHRVAHEEMLRTVSLILIGLTALNYLYNAFASGDRRDIVQAIAVIVVGVGRFVVFAFSLLPVVAVASIVVAVGVGVYARTAYKKYLWV
jgi:hypothetical protein